jgi:hypothetical protein
MRIPRYPNSFGRSRLYRPAGLPDNKLPYTGTSLEVAALADFRLAETFERVPSAPVLDRCECCEGPAVEVPRGL